jgi:hypothetical protein
MSHVEKCGAEEKGEDQEEGRRILPFFVEIWRFRRWRRRRRRSCQLGGGGRERGLLTIKK